MSEKTDRRIRGRLLLYGVIIIITVAVASGAYLWWSMNTPPAGTSSIPAMQGQSMSVQLSRRDEPLMVTLYYPSDGMLLTGSAAVKRQPDTQSQARETLNALLMDQRSSQAALLRDIKLREFYLDASGTAYIDLVPNQQEGLKASTGEELLAIYAMVDTLVLNFEEIKQVSFLLVGREVQTLAGHIDLSRKFTKRVDLVRQ